MLLSLYYCPWCIAHQPVSIALEILCRSILYIGRSIIPNLELNWWPLLLKPDLVPRWGIAFFKTSTNISWDKCHHVIPTSSAPHTFPRLISHGMISSKVQLMSSVHQQQPNAMLQTSNGFSSDWGKTLKP